MVRVLARLRPISGLFLLISTLLLPASPAHAQSAASTIAGTVVDESGGVIGGARVTVLDGRSAAVRTIATDATGAFVVRTLPAGTYTLLVEANLFTSTSQSVVVPSSGAAPNVHVVLNAGGFSEGVVVTARRVDTRLAETPQKVEVIDAADIARSVAADLTDVLKKNAGVDVVQYTGALSGIGIRGFRPQTSGVNKRSLLLIDGRPSGSTNLSDLLLDNVERIEVLKGAASAVYGSSAMGGVVNVITRQSAGKIGGGLRLGGGSFGSTDVGGRVGGRVTPRVDFDATGRMFDQRDDIRMGNGVTRPATSYKTYNGSGRVGITLQDGWRLSGSGDMYRGRDIATPPDIASGTIGQGRKNLERSSGDARLTRQMGVHDLSFGTYRAAEASHSSNVTTSNPLDVPYLPYLSFENELAWVGAQAKDSWTLNTRDHLVIGLDYEKVSSVSRSFARTGEPSAPFSANANKRTVGVYAENTLRLRDGRTVVTLGGRLDRITNETVATPLKTNFTPSESAFNVFSPSLGLKHELVKGLRGHFTVGRAFIPAEASMLTGYTTTIVSGRTQISQGNPDLKPERSTSFDVGAEWSSPMTRFDATVFRTVVHDRFISNVVVSNPAPPDPILVSVTNGLDSDIAGLELEAEQRAGRYVRLFANATHYFTRQDRLASGAYQDILNVALDTVRAGADIDLGHISARFSGRYVRGRKDNDFSAPGFPIVNYDNFTVFDATVSYRLVRQQSIDLAINNVFDAFYYEKLGYPLQGASFKVSYRLGF